MFFKLALLFGVVATVFAHHWQAPGTTVTTVTTTTTTVIADEDSGSSLLNGQDRAIIRRTWAIARRDGDIAPQILLRFLQAHPEYQQKFSKFASVPQDQLRGNGNFLAQAYTILGGLNVVIQSLGSQELLAVQLNALGGAHQQRGISVQQFEQFGQVVQEVLAEELGSQLDESGRQAWKNGIRALVAAISRTLKDPQDLADPQTHLTPRQIADVQRSWENIRKSGEKDAIVSQIFLKLFKETPRAQRAFAKFADVPQDQLSGNAEFQKQVSLVADRLDTVISALDDKLQILGNINYLRYSHDAPRSIERARFEDFGRLLLDILASKGVSGDELSSWKGALGVFIEGVSPKRQ